MALRFSSMASCADTRGGRVESPIRPFFTQQIEQGQILKYNSISRFCSHLKSKRLVNADKKNSLKQKFKTNEAANLP